MVPPHKPARRRKQPLEEILPGMAVSALAHGRDFILCYGMDEETGRKTVHVMTGEFVTPCMLRKLIGRAEAQKDEGSSRVCRPWK